MNKVLVFLPLVLSVLVGLVVFVKSWNFLPVSGAIAFIGYLMLGLVSLGWFSSMPMSGTAVLFTIESLVLAAFFTWRVQRWC